jgi:hypothetical protein
MHSDESEGRSDGKPWWAVEVEAESRTLAREEEERLENKITAKVLTEEERSRYWEKQCLDILWRMETCECVVFVSACACYVYA